MNANAGPQTLLQVAAVDRDSAVHRYDAALILVIVVVLSLGLVMVASASTSIAGRTYGDPLSYFWRQSVHLVVSVGVMVLCVRIPMRFWERTGPLLLLIAVFLLGLVLIPGVGREVNGSTRWISVGGLNLQPSEFTKLCFVLYLAGFIVRRGGDVGRARIGIIMPIAVLALVAGLLYCEPDHGAIFVLCATAFGMLFLAGVPIGKFAAWAAAGSALMVGAALTSPHVVRRLSSFLDPFSDPYGSGFQLVQALIAIGRGGWFGVGLGDSVQKLFYLPEAHTDFLFAVLAEELGLAGMVVTVALYTFLVLRALAIGRQAEDRESWFAGYTAYGIGLLLGLHAFINIGVNIGLLPTKGLTLPLMSYGGSNLVASAAGVGMLLRIDHERRMLRHREGA